MPRIPSASTTTSKLKAVGAWIFAGGFTIGVRKHFDVLCHLEEGDYGVKTCKLNMPELPIHVGVESWPLDKLKSEKLDLLYGNPPCAAWSVAGYTRTRGTDKWKTDPRVACTVKHFGLLKELRPRVWVWESVTQAFTKGREFCDGLAREAAALGYSTTYLLHDSQWFGLPQVRKRFFMVCHRVAFDPIAPSFKSAPTPVEVLAKVKARGQSCSFGRSENKWTAEQIALVQPGERLAKHWERNYAKGPPEQWERNENGSVKGRPSFGHFRLPADRPGGAIVGYCIIHPTEHRFLSTEEMQCLSGFPESYRFTPGGATARMAEIARGVCPPVGEWLARSVRESLAKPRGILFPTIRLVDYRRPPGTMTPLNYTQEPPALDGVKVPERTPSPPAMRRPPVPKQKALLPAVLEHLQTVPKPKANGRRGPVARPQGIGAYIRELLVTNKYSPAQIVAKVKERFPESRATEADVAWNKGKLRKEGKSTS